MTSADSAQNSLRRWPPGTLQERARIELARRTLTDYKRTVWRRYAHAAHLAALDAALEACTRYAESGGREGVSHLLVEMPPRHGKTTTISRLYPTWHLGRNPDHRLIMASYGATLAYRNSRYARNLIMTDIYRAVFPGVDLASDSASVDAWNLGQPHEGGLDAVGVGGGVTGKGGHIIVVDDPVKNREEAESVTYRERVWNWFTDDLYTRREPGAAMIVVMTRWHEDDLVGRLLRDMPGQWQRLRMPAFAEADDVLGRAAGEALWPARYDAAALRQIEDTLHEYAWAGLYQQRPVPAEGGIFKRANFRLVPYVAPERIAHSARYWDLAMSEKTSADYTVGVQMATLTDGRLAVLDVVRERIDWEQVTPLMADTGLGDGAHVPIGFEQQGYMSRAGQDLLMDVRLHAFSVWGYPKDKDKLTNALPFAARVGQGLVEVVEGHWTHAYLDELCSFPAGTHDDQVDASAGAYMMLDGSSGDEGALNHANTTPISQGAY